MAKELTEKQAIATARIPAELRREIMQVGLDKFEEETEASWDELFELLEASAEPETHT